MIHILVGGGLCNNKDKIKFTKKELKRLELRRFGAKQEKLAFLDIKTELLRNSTKVKEMIKEIIYKY